MFYPSVREQVIRAVASGAEAYMVNHSFPQRAGVYQTEFREGNSLIPEGVATVYRAGRELAVNYDVPANVDKSYNTGLGPRHAAKIGTYTEFGLSVGYQVIASYCVGTETRIELVHYTPQPKPAAFPFTYSSQSELDFQVAGQATGQFDVTPLTVEALNALDKFVGANPSVDLLALLAAGDLKTLVSAHAYTGAICPQRTYTISQFPLVRLHAQAVAAQRDCLHTPAIIAARASAATHTATLAAC